jgi:hypothetical protein
VSDKQNVEGGREPKTKTEKGKNMVQKCTKKGGFRRKHMVLEMDHHVILDQKVEVDQHPENGQDRVRDLDQRVEKKKA